MLPALASALRARRLPPAPASLRRALSAHSAPWPTARPAAPYRGPLPHRTHNCVSLAEAGTDEHVVLSGWLLHERKVNRNWSFFDLRDSRGTVQLVASGRGDAPVLPDLAQVPVESPVLIRGSVRRRPEKQRKPGDPLGDIEVLVQDFILLNPADRELPFVPHEHWNLPNDDLRAKYRYLDLRRPSMAENLRKRSKAAHVIRSVLHHLDFIEVETPILLKSSPEGAREFLVPTRLSSSSSEPTFWALQQSPQQPKQLLMCSGAVERYFQIARCFRDEDGRKDRQPEFTQVDLEMAFVSWGPKHGDSPDATSASDSARWRIGGHEVRDVIETLIRKLWKEVAGVAVTANPFPVMTYHQAMTSYGSDKPDVRFGLQLSDITSCFSEDARRVLEASGDAIECLVVRSGDGAFVKAASVLDASFAGAERLIVAKEDDGSWLSDSATIRGSFPAEKLAAEHERGPSEVTNAVSSLLRVQAGDIVWLARRKAVPEGGWTSLGRVRVALAEKAQELGDYCPPPAPHFLWVTEFPLFTHADEDKDFLAHGRWSSSHHPFTAPMMEDIDAMYAGRIAQVRGQHYDLVLNGVEIGGGSVRVHDPEMQEYIFSQILQLTEAEKSTFGHLLHALRCGAPPHGGIALGFDRLMSILCNTNTIRDVIAFPKTGASTDPLFKSPSPTTSDVLATYGLAPCRNLA
ncbi:hypothetical protein PUNSTDRAFT_51287 [Punctularia strigosozonata HHB-11173 SS5]|uniref:uncharacterized protein n=1 Tax=Punctularia strigosozonata (strain HHB-11173) TaxID=741275 RepID=UPI00044178F8|nr:uncharacterized protein PUNSTDRAFT_51287 [Punctularia strigosozonata HHB-11173 SS5]EIN10682.1 hypothetical protein PUNSTDRAFT_51287 [Punctularia strigosozonata HHB-11173 SS5]